MVKTLDDKSIIVKSVFDLTFLPSDYSSNRIRL